VEVDTEVVNLQLVNLQVVNLQLVNLEVRDQVEGMTGAEPQFID
jgi:hypothetical protein